MLKRWTQGLCHRRGWAVALVAGIGLAGAGCGGFSIDGYNLLGVPLFGNFGGGGGDGGPPTPPTDDDDDGFFDGGAGGPTDPCLEELDRKFVRLSLRNQSPDFVHYFMVLIAFEDTPDQQGAVCSDDLGLYTDFGYEFIASGQFREFGAYCIDGPALLYFHEAGNFQAGGGTGAEALASAIAPAQGSSPTFDNFFGSSGVLVPVPDLILFHNPGTGQGASFIVDPLPSDPCDEELLIDFCTLDSFYYVDEDDLPAGSLALGVPGSARRTPNDIQDTFCESGGFSPFHFLVPPGVSNVAPDEFVRGGSIEYVFIRDDREQAIPQLLWRVRDASGGIVQDFAVTPQ